MMGCARYLIGQIRVRCVSADVSLFLAKMEHARIQLNDVIAPNDITLEFTVNHRDLKKVRELSAKRGERLTVISRRGLRWPLKATVRRPLLVCGLIIVLTIGMLLPARILFIDVEGNERIPSQRIVEAARQSGLTFGSSRRRIRSEQIKNRLLDSIPELKWAGVNTHGSKAVITVRERDDNQVRQETYPVCHVIASRDGVVVSTTVTSGSGVCGIGQAVRKGDILISGYTDCGITIRASAANGIILAATNRNLTAITPTMCYRRSTKGQIQCQYSLILGKKRINLYKGSGISGGSCGKMQIEYVLTLPGGFELPVSLLREQIAHYDYSESRVDDPEILLQSFASDYLKTQMSSGEVTSKDEQILESGELWILNGQYACIEDIGIRQDEKIGDFHGKTDGTDRERRQSG